MIILTRGFWTAPAVSVGSPDAQRGSDSRSRSAARSGGERSVRSGKGMPQREHNLVTEQDFRINVDHQGI